MYSFSQITIRVIQNTEALADSEYLESVRMWVNVCVIEPRSDVILLFRRMKVGQFEQKPSRKKNLSIYCISRHNHSCHGAKVVHTRARYESCNPGNLSHSRKICTNSKKKKKCTLRHRCEYKMNDKLMHSLFFGDLGLSSSVSSPSSFSMVYLSCQSNKEKIELENFSRDIALTTSIYFVSITDDCGRRWKWLHGFTLS